MAGDLLAYESAMDQGHTAAWDRCWDLAANYYRQALKEYPENTQALVSLGLALFELQSNQEALKCYLKAARLSSDDPLPVEKISQIYERLGNLERASQAALHAAELYLKNRDLNKAVELWEFVTCLQPDDQKAFTRLAAVFERIGEKERAAGEYLSLAHLHQLAGENEKATASIDRAMVLAPSSQKALQFRNLLQASQPLPPVERKKIQFTPQPGADISLLEESEFAQTKLPLDPIEESCQKAITDLAGLLFDNDDIKPEPSLEWQPGKDRVQAGLGGGKTSQRARVLFHLSQLIDLQTRNEFEKAAIELSSAVENGLDHPAADFDLGYLYFQSGFQEEALQQLRSSLSHPDYSLGAHLLVGDIHRQMGQVLEASLEYLQALKLVDVQSASPDAKENLSQLYESLIEAYREQPVLETQSRLVEDIRQMLQRPDWREQVENVRSKLSDGGMPRPLAEVLTDTGGNQLIAILYQVRELKRARRIRSAMEEVFYALDIAPLYLPLHTLIADLLVDLGEVQAAIDKYMLIARVYSIRAEPSQAMSIYRKVIGLAPANIEVRNELISQLKSSGQVEAAALELVKLAEVYMSLADLSLASDTYKKVLRMDGPSKIDENTRIDVLRRLADIDLQSLDWKHAIRLFEQIRALRPGDEQVRYKLVNLNFRLGQENRAVKELVDYLELLRSTGAQSQVLPILEGFAAEFPDSIPLRQVLAEEYVQHRRSDQAIIHLDWIGRQLLKNGDRPGAMNSVQGIISLNPPNKSEYEGLLVQLSRVKA